MFGGKERPLVREGGESAFAEARFTGHPGDREQGMTDSRTAVCEAGKRHGAFVIAKPPESVTGALRVAQEVIAESLSESGDLCRRPTRVESLHRHGASGAATDQIQRSIFCDQR